MHAESPKPVTRAYSIACRPEDAANGRLVFNIRLAVPPAGHEVDMHPGVVSSHLFSLKPGDELEVSGPFGDFPVQPTRARDGVHRWWCRHGAVEGHGARADRARDQAARCRTITARARPPICSTARNSTPSRPPTRISPGRRPCPSLRRAIAGPARPASFHEIVRNAMRNHPAPEDCEYYLCGPPVMISAVLAMLERIGVEPHSIFNDDFGI